MLTKARGALAGAFLSFVALPLVPVPAALAIEPGTHAVTIRWLPPLENEDGSALTNLAGYRIYRGDTIKNLKPYLTVGNPGLARFHIESLHAGKHVFTITALTSAGKESAMSPPLTVYLYD